MLEYTPPTHCMLGYIPPGHTDTCEKITFLQLLLRTVKNSGEWGRFRFQSVNMSLVENEIKVRRALKIEDNILQYIYPNKGRLFPF